MEEEESRRLLILRVGSYAGERALHLALTAVAGVFVARHLGPDGLGLLTYVQSLFGLLAPVALLGLPPILAREFSIRDDWRSVLASALTYQVPVALVTSLAGLLLVASTRAWDAQAVLTAVALAPLPLLSLSQSLRSYLEATQRVRAIVAAGAVGAVTGFVVKVMAVVLEADVWVFALASSIEAACVVAGLAIGIPGRKAFNRIRMYTRGDIARGLLRESWPLLLSAVAVTIYVRVDTVMLALISGDQETGIYAAAARLSEVWYFLPMAALAAVRPRLSRLFASGEMDTYRRTLQRFATAATATSYGAVLGVLFLGDTVIRLLYGESYAASAGVLRLHVLAAPFVFLGVVVGPWFIDRSLSSVVLMRATSGAVLNVVLNLILIPRHGAIGAAIATLISYAGASVVFHAILPSTRPIFALQVRSLLLRWR